MSTSQLSICVCYAQQARTAIEQQLYLPLGSTVQDAIATLDLSREQMQTLFMDSNGNVRCGIWGKKVSVDTMLQDGDRVELYRDLEVDPKTARRLRFARQGSRTAGLFARRGTK